jgi:enoyl-CoA hydratase/carnithine racemase
MSDFSNTDDVVLRSEGTRIRTLTLNRPTARNALDEALHTALLSAVRSVAADPDVRAVVITGTGPAFSAGGDFGFIEEMQEDADLRQATLSRGRSLFWSLIALEIPVIAAVNGPAVGAGATLALLSDIVLMAQHAYLAEPRVNIGLVPGDGGAIVWPLLAGVPAARAYLFTGDHLPAEEAYRLGLVHRVVDGDSLLAEAMELADRLAGLSAHSVRATKRALNLALESAALAGFELALEAESQSFDTPELLTKVQQHSGRATGRTDG